MVRIALRLAKLFPLIGVLLVVSCFTAQANDSVPVAVPATSGDALWGGGAAIPRPGLEELVDQADLIVVGRVDSLNSYWNPEHTHVFTDVGVSVERVIKGTPVGDVVVRAPGGTAEGITEWISDAPSFAVGERALLFLKSEGEGLHSLANRRWGKEIVEDDRVLPMDLPLDQVISNVGQILRKQGLATPAGNLVQEEASFTLPTPLSGTPAVTTPPAAAGWQDIMTENFEGTFPGTKWTLGGNPTWGKDDYNPGTGTYSGWCARGGTLGKDPELYYYPNSMNAWMVYGPFNLTGASDAELDFYFWLQSQTNYDFLSWMASVDGNNFYGYQVSGDSGGWLYYGFDLTSVPTLGNLTGQGSLWIAFRFSSNASTVDDGAFLDEIALRKYPTAGTAPTISSITPSSASAGTASNVTIGGSNFGATKGSSKVTFYYQAGQPRIEAPVVSWSANSIVATVPVGIIGWYMASASSGPAVVTTSGGDSNDYQFEVPFSYIGAKWPGASPEVHYVVNHNTADVTGEEVAVQAAATTWSTVSGADFQFLYDGATSATQATYNGTNEVMWRSAPGEGWLAGTYWLEPSGDLLEFDIEFNDYYTWSTTGAAGTFDVQNIATHELGHALGLRDLYGDVGSPNDMDKTMYGFGDTGETYARTLEPGDQAGVIWIYPAPATPPDLTITKSASPPDGSNVTSGSTITYTVTVSNVGGSAATNVPIRDTIGAGLSLTSVTPGSGIVCGDTTPQEINCTAASIAPGESRTVTIAATVDAASGTVLNGARADPANVIAEANEDADDPDRDCTTVGEGTDAATTEPDNFDCTGHNVQNCSAGIDTDGDGYDDDVECYMTTDPLDACPDNTSDDAWPPDIQAAEGCGFHNGQVNILDVLCYKPKLSGPYDVRYDMDTNGVVNILDVLLFKPVFGAQCTNP